VEPAVTRAAAIEIDVSLVRDAGELHRVLAAALGLPTDCRATWDAFRELACSGAFLPERLMIRGLDHLERRLPHDAASLLDCIRDANNAGRGACRAAVTDDYSAPLYFIRYEARPITCTPVPDAMGAFINCWIKADSPGEAHRIATASLVDHGWAVVGELEIERVILNLSAEDDDSFVRQACIDDAVFAVHTWTTPEPAS
jgi:hypothetical protein